VHYKVGEERLTVNVATTGLISITDNIPRDHKQKGKYEEFVQSPRTSFLALPIFDWGRTSAPRKVMPLGVVRFINRVSPWEGGKAALPFGWDDVVICEYIAELIGVVTNYLRRAQEEQDHFERVIHGIKANITAVLLNIAHLADRPDAVTINNPKMTYILSDSLAMMRDIKWQVERNVAWYGPRFDTSVRQLSELKRIRITGDVLAKVRGMVPDMAKVHNAGYVSCEYSNYDVFIKLPEVLGDVSALTTVFRNVIENAIKYTRPESADSRVVLDYRIGPEFLEILVDDNGIGVAPGEASWIFVDGYRGDNAIRRRPAGGSGIGLPHSQDLMLAMGGDLYYEPVVGGTRFVVRLRLAGG